MAIDAAFLACFNQVINVAKPSTLAGDNSAECTYGTPAPQNARVERQTRMVLSANGKERASKTLILTEQAIADDDLVWLPGVDSTQRALAREPMDVEVATDTDGTPHHYEVSV